VEKYGRAGQATDDKIIRRKRVAFLITKVKITRGIPNTYCFSSLAMETRPRLIVTLHAHCPSYC